MPGLFIGQHAGGGKAKQLFLRGFDLDHGTDIRFAVTGLNLLGPNVIFRTGRNRDGACPGSIGLYSFLSIPTAIHFLTTHSILNGLT
ncbi:hypothetical protein [Spirosoma taeanense]|uniref:hypothetical protein n=1 Tax=Spirosoma taeanense TaxID=2735870 RepID=UPI001F038607|nr:hypothetical protein [Spirosoma taeanense]